jgi:beta-mannosidase
MQSRAMEHHNRAFQGTERLFKLLSGYFRVPGDFEDVVYLMQLTQGEGVKVGVEHWRARKFRTAGTLFWQLNDCWPVTSWSCLDYAHRPKALYYYAKRFFAPLLPVIDYRDGRFSVRVVNDRPSPFEGELICGFGRVNGDQHWVDRQPCHVPANGAADGASRTTEELATPDPTRDYFWCRLIEDDREIARNARFLAPYKHVALPAPEWEVSVESTDTRRHTLRLTNWCFAKAAWLRVSGMEAEFSDNFFDLFPELPTEVQVETPQDISPAELQRRLEIRSVAEARHREA